MVVRTGVVLHQRRPPFRFFNFWADDPSFLEIVEQVWSSPSEGNPLFSLRQKLKMLKVRLKVFNKDNYNNLPNRTTEARETLRIIQEQCREAPGCVTLIRQELAALKALIDCSKVEESFFQQKSRALWIEEGDHNTAYFHSKVKDRANMNKIVSLSRVDGSRIYDVDLIQAETVSYFQDLFSEPFLPNQHLEQLDSTTIKRIPQAAANDMEKVVTPDEVKAIIFKMNPPNRLALMGTMHFSFKNAGRL